MLEEKWASPEDFATLFQYFWHRDFPLGQEATGAHRADWTTHIAIVIRNIADLMGFVTRFETGGKKDAVLRGIEGDEIAIEWEWSDVLRWINVPGNEVEKLRTHKVFSNDKSSQRLLKYAVLIAYTHTPSIEKVYTHVIEKWKGAQWPLLLILIDVIDVPRRKISSGREFQNIQMYLFDKSEPTKLRSAPALPWKVPII